MWFIWVPSGPFCLGKAIDLQRAVQEPSKVNGPGSPGDYELGLGSAGRCGPWVGDVLYFSVYLLYEH